jgi:hypothetical protein
MLRHMVVTGPRRLFSKCTMTSRKQLEPDNSTDRELSRQLLIQLSRPRASFDSRIKKGPIQSGSFLRYRQVKSQTATRNREPFLSETTSRARLARSEPSEQRDFTLQIQKPGLFVRLLPQRGGSFEARSRAQEFRELVNSEAKRPSSFATLPTTDIAAAPRVRRNK